MQKLYKSKINEDLKIRCYEVIIKSNGQKAMAKVYKFEKNNSQIKEGLSNQMKILQHLSGKHPSFMDYYGSFIIPKRETELWYILIEYCPETLHDIFSKRKLERNPYSFQDSLRIIIPLIEVFVILDDEKITHRNLNPESIHINSYGVLKIGNFEYSQQAENENYFVIGKERLANS